MALMRHREVIRHNGRRIQQSSGFHHVEVVVTTVEVDDPDDVTPEVDCDDILTRFAETQEEVEAHWAEYVARYGPPAADPNAPVVETADPNL